MADKQILGDDAFGRTPEKEALVPDPRSVEKGGRKGKTREKADLAKPAATAPSPPKPDSKPEKSKRTRPPSEVATAAAGAPAVRAPEDQALVAPPCDRPSDRPVYPARPVYPTSEPERRNLPLSFFAERCRAIAMRDRSDSVDEFGRDPRVSARVDPILDFLYRTYFRVDARGLGHLPDEGRALIVSNHSGTLPYDGAMIMHTIRHEKGREVRPLVEDFVFHFPYLGTFMNRIGGVRACPENAERLLRQDRLVAVFPEGIKGIGKLFRDRYRLQRFGRGGFIKLALRTNAPIIPTAVVGAEEIHPMLTKLTWLTRTVGIPYIPITPTFPLLGPLGALPLPTKWVIAFGAPLYFNTEYGSDGSRDRILVNKLAEEVRQRIQGMIDEILRKRRSVWLG